MTAHGTILRFRGAYHLRDTNAEEIKVANARELEEELLRYEIPDGVTRGANVVRYVRMAAPCVNEGRIVLNLQGNAPAILGRLDMLSTKYQVNDCPLVRPGYGSNETANQFVLERNGLVVETRIAVSTSGDCHAGALLRVWLGSGHGDS